MTDSTAKPPRKPFLLPWKIAIALALVLFAAVIPSMLTVPQTAPAAMAGVLVGLLGSVFGTSPRAAAALLTTAVAALATTAIPITASVLIIAPVLAALAAGDSLKTGGRTFVVGLFAWVMLLVPIGAGPPYLMIGVFAAAGIYGIVMARLLGVTGAVPADADTRAEAIALFLFLSVGLGLAFWISHRFNDPKALWIAQMFVMRGLSSHQLRTKAAIRFGVGVVAGAAVAAALELLGLPLIALLALASAAIVVALRTIMLPMPIAPAGFSIGALLATAPTVQAAIFRIEAALIVAALTIALAWIIERLMPRSDSQPSKP